MFFLSFFFPSKLFIYLFTFGRSQTSCSFQLFALSQANLLRLPAHARQTREWLFSPWASARKQTWLLKSQTIRVFFFLITIREEMMVRPSQLRLHTTLNLHFWEREQSLAHSVTLIEKLHWDIHWEDKPQRCTVEAPHRAHFCSQKNKDYLHIIMYLSPFSQCLLQCVQGLCCRSFFSPNKVLHLVPSIGIVHSASHVSYGRSSLLVSHPNVHC